jgi:uncharacterized protein YceH (UPF0502 family)
LFSGELAVEESVDPTATPAANDARGPTSSERIQTLEQLVAQLRRELDELKAQLQ